MQSTNIYHAPNPQDKNRAFNSGAGTFADTAYEVTFEERQASLAAREAMIVRIRKSLEDF